MLDGTMAQSPFGRSLQTVLRCMFFFCLSLAGSFVFAQPSAPEQALAMYLLV